MTGRMLGVGVFVLGILGATWAVAQAPAPSAGTATNLLSNGDFEKPIQWGKDWTTPQRPLVSLAGNASHGAHCIHMKVPAAEAAAEGVVILSEFVPCEPGGTYRVKYDLKGSGPTVIVFVEAYDPKYIGRPQGDYRKQCDRLAPGSQWTTQEHVFRIRNSPHSRSKISKMQVKVYAYWPQGEVWVDNVVLEPAPPEALEQEK